VDASGSGQGPMAHSCEHSNKPLGSIKDGKFLDSGQTTDRRGHSLDTET
jgi:hypothetical protein